MARMKTVTVDLTVRVTMKVPVGCDEEEIQEIVSEFDPAFEDPTDTVEISESEIIDSEVLGADDSDFDDEDEDD